MTTLHSMTTPVMVSSENGRYGLLAALQELRNGGRALDAVELACRIVEDDPADHSVGYGGIPNLTGDVELDASLMEGRTLRSGSVAAVRGFANPISLARRVMEELPHVLLVGRGAEQFATELGQTPTEQRTAEGLAIWHKRFVERGVAPGDTADLRTRARHFCEPVRLQDRVPAPLKDDTLGTVNFLALDQYGDLASAVSTSGIAWKYPGRVGDSPIIGAGNYCDNRYGAVACTGMGELAIRAGTARSVILYLKQGLSVPAAGLEALRDIYALAHDYDRRMSFIVLAPDGQHAGFSTIAGSQYLYMSATMAEPALAARTPLT
ncbi:MAG TPA: N(4)-(beta-N-acetylglucosaminyl)-L-asparaginase [Caldilineaceae bacterium]|nr:N(4)-(beta-N-acetylglucosaminyl)-L-asparaginase [Caldilineaceae bacterium]